MANLTYDALDLHVIRGRADDQALALTAGEQVSAVSYATLIEEVAALAGALRALGVAAHDHVLIALAEEHDELLAFLAVLRLRAVPVLAERVHAGAVDVPGHHPSTSALATRHRPKVIVTATPWPGHVYRPDAVLYRGPEPRDETREVSWEVALRAGRTDPAPAQRAPQGTPLEEATAYVVGDRAILMGEVPEVGTQIGRRLGGLVGGRVVRLGR